MAVKAPPMAPMIRMSSWRRQACCREGALYKGGVGCTRPRDGRIGAKSQPSPGPSRRGAAAAPPPARARGRAPARGRPRWRGRRPATVAPWEAAAAAASRSRPWTRRPCRHPGAPFPIIDSRGAARRRTPRRSRRAPRRRPALPPRATCRRAAGTRASEPRRHGERRRVAVRSARCAIEAATKFLHDVVHAVPASSRRSKNDRQLALGPRGAASRSGGRGGPPQSPRLSAGRLHDGMWRLRGRRRRRRRWAAAAARGAPPPSRVAVVFSLQPSCPSRRDRRRRQLPRRLDEPFARRRVGLIGFCGRVALFAPGVPLPACSIVGVCQRRAPAGPAPAAVPSGAGPRVRRRRAGAHAPGGHDDEDAGRTPSWPSMV